MPLTRGWIVSTGRARNLIRSRTRTYLSRHTCGSRFIHVGVIVCSAAGSIAREFGARGRVRSHQPGVPVERQLGDNRRFLLTDDLEQTCLEVLRYARACWFGRFRGWDSRRRLLGLSVKVTPTRPPVPAPTGRRTRSAYPSGRPDRSLALI